MLVTSNEELISRPDISHHRGALWQPKLAPLNLQLLFVSYILSLERTVFYADSIQLLWK